MIRLIVILVFGIGLTFAVAGRDSNLPQGSDQPDAVEVTRLDALESEPLLRPASIEPAQDAAQNTAMSIPLDNHTAALQAALRATEQGVPAPQPAVATVTAASTLPEAPAPNYWYVTGNRVNLRSGPSTSTAVIGQVTRGQEALVLEQTSDGWYRIEAIRTGTTGFIFGRFLSEQEPL